VISEDDVPKGCRKRLGDTHANRINTMVNDIVLETLRVGGGHLSISKEVLSAIVQLRDFLWERVYENQNVHTDFHKAAKILKELYRYFIDHPDDFLKLVEKTSLYDSLERCVTDFLAGMTDRYAFRLYEERFLPLPWMIL